MVKVPQIKVCGMRDETNIKGLVKLAPDYMGFIFYEKSPRYIINQLNASIVDTLPSTIKKVGVFVNAGEAMVKNAVIAYGLDLVQLHGDESPELCYLFKQSGLEVIKAFRIDENFDFYRTRLYESSCDYYLFDTATQAFGGSGLKFNWELLKKYNNARPVFLSGGIGEADIEQIEALDWLNLKALDVNSKFEIAPGLKDLEKLRSFICKVRSAKSIVQHE